MRINRTLRVSTATPTVLILTLALISTAALSAQEKLQTGPSPQASTEQGPVVGMAAASGARAFLGIPFAAPPVGKLRWQAPQPAPKREGTLQATAFGSHCMQFGSSADIAFHDAGASEDCLTLNIWTPSTARPGAKLPVMLWIYGGGYVFGSTSENRQNGQYLAQKRGVIVVSMNYRLGIFGFMVHPELTAESPMHASGNYGLLDQSAALAWVQRNIAGFGGDPANITLFGESAGSWSVSYQMASPLSRTRIAKAIGESGGAFPVDTTRTLSLNEREKSDSDYLQQVFGTVKLDALRTLPAEAIVAAVTAKSAPSHRFWPCVDGYFLPKPVEAIYAAGEQAHVPLLAGWNADEARSGILMGREKPTAASFKAQAEKDFGPLAPEFLAVYPAATDADAKQSAGDYAGDKFIQFGTWTWLEAAATTGHAPVYRYRLDLGNPGDRYHPASTGAFHSDDIEYVFGTLDSRVDSTIRPVDRALSDQMQQYWTNFAKTGDPNGGALPDWPVYAATKWQVMHLDAASAAKPDDQRGRYLFLTRAWSRP